jgi:hypothetical protein
MYEVEPCQREGSSSHGLSATGRDCSAAHGPRFYVSFSVVWCRSVLACVVLS